MSLRVIQCIGIAWDVYLPYTQELRHVDTIREEPALDLSHGHSGHHARGPVGEDPIDEFWCTTGIPIEIVWFIVIAIAASRVMESLLYDTPARDPIVSVGVAVLLVAIAAVASAGPARRAMRVDPVKALKAE